MVVVLGFAFLLLETFLSSDLGLAAFLALADDLGFFFSFTESVSSFLLAFSSNAAPNISPRDAPESTDP